MLPTEANLIYDWIKSLDLPGNAVCLNIGSSTGHFRTQEQPHVGKLMSNLENLGIQIIHCDLKSAEGVDEAGDVLSLGFQARLRSYGAHLLICANLLEHLTAPSEFAAACGSLVSEGAYGLFTVPRSFPYHPDPIDTMFRPSPSELASLLPDWEIIEAKVIVAGQYSPDAFSFAKEVVRVALPFYKPREWWPRAHRLFWLFKPYEQTMALLRKRGQPA